MTYILIMTLITGQAAAISTVVFNQKNSCEYAAQEWLNKTHSILISSKAICVKNP